MISKSCSAARRRKARGTMKTSRGIRLPVVHRSCKGSIGPNGKGWFCGPPTPRNFRKNRAQFQHEAEMIAALAEVIGREGFEFADDDTYLEYAHAMREAAIEAADAARKKNFDQARKAVATIEKNCNSCHEGFRS